MTTEHLISKTPKVTVLMSVFNGEHYLNEAIDSILAQTFIDFEFLIIDDTSTDRTSEILLSYGDPRIRIITNEQNLGLTKSLNKGLALARGEYIARMDADDISMSDRLKKQVKFLDENSSVALLGSSWYFIDRDGKKVGYSKAFCDVNSVHFMCHGTVIIRKCCLDKIGNFREIFEYAQDYDLCLRIVDEFEISNLCEPLYNLRIHGESISSTKKMKQNLYASLALKMSTERGQKGRDQLSYLSQNEALELRDKWLGMSGFNRRKVLSYTYTTWSQAAFKLNIYGRSLKYAIDAITFYALNTEAWIMLFDAFKNSVLEKYITVNEH